MLSTARMMIESHRSAATLYAAGDLTTADIVLAIGHLEQLPENVRALCIDLRGVLKMEPNAMRILEVALREWRAARRGMSRVELPHDAGSTLVAIRFAHRRWSFADRDGPAQRTLSADARRIRGDARRQGGSVAEP